jgi:hypothetical protein
MRPDRDDTRKQALQRPARYDDTGIDSKRLHRLHVLMMSFI